MLSVPDSILLREKNQPKKKTAQNNNYTPVCLLLTDKDTFPFLLDPSSQKKTVPQKLQAKTHKCFQMGK